MKQENKKKEKTPEEKLESRKEIFRTIKFVLFSISAGVIEFCSFLLFSNLPGYNPSWYRLAAYSSLTLSVAWNFTFNRKFTFQSAANVPIAMLKVLGYYLVFAPLSIEFCQLYLIDTLGWGKWELLIKAITMLVNFVTEFLFQRFFVFGKSIDTKPVEFKKKNKVEDNNEKEAK